MDMGGGVSSLVLLVLSSNYMLVGGQNCSLSDVQFLSSNLTVRAESVRGSTPGARVTWSTTLPPECVTSVSVNFRTTTTRVLAAANTTTSTSQTEVIQTGLQCGTSYYIRVVVSGEPINQGVPKLQLLFSSQVQLFIKAIPILFGVRAEATTDNTSIRVSWQWSCRGALDLVRVRYQPEGGSLMVYTVGNTTSTSATLTNLLCNTKYTIWVYYVQSGMGHTSVSRMVYLPARAPPTPIDVTVQLTSASSVRATWQWMSLGSVSNCFNTTTVTYHPEGGDESSLQLSDPAATEATLTDLQCNINYTITVVATAGEHRREGVVKTVLPQLQDIPRPVGVRTEATVDNTSISVSWEWSLQGVVACVDNVIVLYQPEGGSLMTYTVDNTTATSATLLNLQCNTKYTVRVQVRGGSRTGRRRSPSTTVSLPAKAPPTPTEVTTQFTSATNVKVTWQWTSLGPAPNCFNTTTVTYRPEGGGESSLQLSDPTATEATLTNLQCNTSYTITVVATAGEHRRQGVGFLSLQGLQNFSATVLSPTSVHLMWVAPCNTQQYHIYYRGTCGAYVDESRLDTGRQEYTFDGLQEGINYSFTVNQTGFSGGGVLSTGPVYARTFTAVPSGAPQSLEAMFVQSTEVSLWWREVPCIQQNGPINSYVVQYFATHGANRDAQNKLVVTTEDIISGLTPNTEYAFQVAAVNVNGTGPFSEPITLGGPPDQDMPQSSSTSGLVAGAVVTVFVLVIAAVCIVVLIVWLRHRYRSGKSATVELADTADSDSVDSKEEQDTSVDNFCYDKVHIRKNASVKLNDMVGKSSADSKEEQNMVTSVDNVCYDKLPTSSPIIVDYQRQVQCLEGEQVSLMVKATGSPTPTVSWFFNGRKVEDDYSAELGKDGSLVLVSAELKHAGIYTFIVSNRVGNVKGCTKLVVHAEDEDHASVSRVENNPVNREKFGEFVSTFHAYNNTAFVGQFQALTSGEEGHQTTIGKTPANNLLNRFKNITAYDDCRVVLKSISDGVDCEHDYINATYIDGYSQCKKYIATQGPLPNTVNDFWWLVWQERVHIVAMVTNTVERGQQKCEHYWPDEGIKEYGPFKVTLAEQQVFADYTIRQLFVSCDKVRGSQLKVTQFHFTSWPDHGVPEYAGPILNYLCRMKAQIKLSRGPTLVHCSAGIGRTGTLIAIDMALEQAAQENVVDIPAIVTKMRRQRMKMVQNSEQYVFIHDAVLESLTCGDTQIPASGLSGAIKKLKEKDRVTGRTGFETQFHVLGLVTPKPTEVIRASALRFPDLNRSLDFLPPEKWRVVLKGESKDYIHASFANGYKHRRGFIIAQAPMKSTCQDFWKMVYERECGVIVILSDLVENGEEVCYQYWPADDTKGVQKYGQFTVSVLLATKQNGFIRREISINNPKSGQTHNVTQFQMSCWTPEGLCTSPPAIMAVIEHVLVIQRRTGNKPIVVHGSDTVSRCGVFCSFISATECCKTEGIVDVFQVVKALRIQKPGSVATVEQYCFIFDLMLLFLESFNIYSNFK